MLLSSLSEVSSNNFQISNLNFNSNISTLLASLAFLSSSLDSSFRKIKAEATMRYNALVFMALTAPTNLVAAWPIEWNGKEAEAMSVTFNQVYDLLGD